MLSLSEYGESAALLTANIETREGTTQAVSFTAGEASSEAAWALVHNFSDWLLAFRPPGVLGTIPTYDKVLVEFDPLATDHSTVYAFARSWLASQTAEKITQRPAGRTFTVPVLYGGDAGPDLTDTAEQQGLSIKDVVNLHVGMEHPIRCLAQHGSIMLDGPPLPKPVKRRAEPRTRVPLGSVMLAGTQAVILPTTSPSGWQVIGRTPLNLINHDLSSLINYAPGDIIRYAPITEDEWSSYAKMAIGDLDD
ncbi:sensor histidine kinase inhibitor, KipI family [Arthrobacter sp. yr096]|uniref:5-oxoprolinase subunit B family protein n=1 Tax=Arthrobacter sp. yr096 TaxID=1761750 RepID=UPI0008B74F36|nr:carboxyltransferase domain-containing protein [Arthrobacter sp. yr096]SEJ77899.1 sensor histidine kinase inhibitor, KipI family [Arthrobacter sp. yr096]